MTTATIIMAIALIILMAVAILLIVRYSKKLTEVELKAQELEQQEKGLMKKHNSLDRWETELKAEASRQDDWLKKRKHVSAVFRVADNAQNKPSKKSISKSLSSKIGYAIRKEYPAIKETHDDANGCTNYSVDFYVTYFD